ncbi:MAG: long-chain fatty acid transport protein, partial [Calditrichia bacterium]
MTRQCILLIKILFILTVCLSAQDANYWTNQYGARANLLGGAVVGSVVDLSGTFYNPGALPFLKNTDFILAA